MTAQSLSNEGLAFLAAHEGIVPAPYRDSVGVLTWGVGHTKAAGAPDPASLPLAMPANIDDALRRVLRTYRVDVMKYEAGVRRAFTRPLTQTQFDAAVSFHYNTGSIGRASWVKAFNSGDTAGAARGIMNWSKPKSIISRRKAERDLFAHGDYGAAKIAVFGTDGRGGVIWKPVRTLDRIGLLNLMHDASPPVRPDMGHIEPDTAPAVGLFASLAAVAALIGAFIWRKKK